MAKRYNIIRYFSKQGKAPQIIRKNVTLKEAQAHCQREDTRKAGIWFDGYADA